MKVAFVKLDKFEKIGNDSVEYNFSNLINEIKIGFINTRNWVKNKTNAKFNIIKWDKNKDTFYVRKFNVKTINKLKKILAKNGYDFVLTEDGTDIGYRKIDSSMFTKYFLPEIKKYIFQISHPVLDEVYICVNEYNNDNISIILDMIQNSKVVNIITDNHLYYYYEKQMEQKEIYFNVLSNKRKSLKKAYFVINLDFKSLNGFNINRNMVIVDASNAMLQVPLGFNGIIIKKCKINTKKALRIFSDFENFDKEKMIEYELLKCTAYNSMREKIRLDKIYVENVCNNRIIDVSDIKRTSNVTV